MSHRVQSKGCRGCQVAATATAKTHQPTRYCLLLTRPNLLAKQAVIALSIIQTFVHHSCAIAMACLRALR